MSLDQKQVMSAAATIREAYEAKSPIAALRNSYDMEIDDAYAVQEENTKHWLKQGRLLSGRKIGVTSHAVQSQLGVNQPDFGMLFSDMAFADGQEISMSHLLQRRMVGGQEDMIVDVALDLVKQKEENQSSLKVLFLCISF